MSVFQSVSSSLLGLFYEEVHVARYLTFPESGGFTVPDPASGISDRHIQFEAPGVVDGSVAVVCFQTVLESSKASFSARLNSTPHLVMTSSDNADPQSWMKLALPGALTAEHDELTFAVSEGSVRFSDVFVLYTSNQLTVRKRRPIVTAP